MNGRLSIGPARVAAHRLRGLATPAVLVALLGLTGCAGDPREAYCEEVAEQQEPLTEITTSGQPDALIRALPIFRELEEKAPRDIEDEWAVVLDGVEGLQEALEAAGVDPAAYDVKDLPDSLTDEERQRIEAAATELTSPATVQAFDAVDQQARDVCHTPLSL